LRATRKGKYNNKWVQLHARYQNKKIQHLIKLVKSMHGGESDTHVSPDVIRVRIKLQRMEVTCNGVLIAPQVSVAKSYFYIHVIMRENKRPDAKIEIPSSILWFHAQRCGRKGDAYWIREIPKPQR
jgi:hypothetical protein